MKEEQIRNFLVSEIFCVFLVFVCSLKISKILNNDVLK